MTHPMPGSGWLFITKKNRTDVSDWDWLVYPVAYFEDGIPWFATPVSPTLRRATPSEEYWGALVSPGQNSAAAWNELTAQRRRDLAKVSQWIRDFLVEEGENGKVSREKLRSYADEEFNPVAVTVALSTPDFRTVSDTDGGMYWTLTERS